MPRCLGGRSRCGPAASRSRPGARRSSTPSGRSRPTRRRRARLGSSARRGRSRLPGSLKSWHHWWSARAIGGRNCCLLRRPCRARGSSARPCPSRFPRPHPTAPGRIISSKKIACWRGVPSRPPYSAGQAIAANRASASSRCQAQRVAGSSCSRRVLREPCLRLGAERAVLGALFGDLVGYDSHESV